jgi:O-antigen ligase
MRARVIRGVVILVIVTLFWVPQAVFKRFTITSERSDSTAEYTDERLTTYGTAVKYFPEYVLTGFGISPLYDKASSTTKVWYLSETHNIFLQVTVFWGLFGLLALLTLVWQAYQCLPRRSGAEPLGLCLRGLGASLLVYSLFVHNLEDKEFSIVLGLLAGASCWIWPKTLTSRDTSQLGMRYKGTVADDGTASGRNS